jgi:hypothetical protein
MNEIFGNNVNIKRNNIYILTFKMVEYIMKNEIFGAFHEKCGTRDLT